MKTQSILFIAALMFLVGVILPGSSALESSKYEEPKCAKSEPAKNLKADWISKTAAWFVPLASKYYYNRWAERLQNRSAQANELSQLCLKLLFLASDKPKEPYMVVVGGLKKAVIIKCKSTGPHSQECDDVMGAPGYQPGVDSKEVIVATDNKKYLVMASCIRDSLKSWYVMTPAVVTLSDKTKKDILKSLKKMGYDVPSKASMLNYSKCPKGVVNPVEAIQKPLAQPGAPAAGK